MKLNQSLEIIASILYSSDDLLEMAIRSRHNSIVLKDSAFALFDKPKSESHALFLYYSALEEFQKGLFCMFAHRGFMKESQLEPIFKNHATKIILFQMIFRNEKFYIKNSKFYYDGVLFEDLDIKNLPDVKDGYKKYMEKRNDCLYVRFNDDKTSYDPSTHNLDVEERRLEIHDEMTYLNAMFDTTWQYDFVGEFSNFDYYKLTPKDKPVKYQFTFSGSGILNLRTNFRTDRFLERLGKL